MSLPGLVEPWFPAAEHAERLRRVQSGLAARGLDGILLFQPESVTWVTGFYTRGYASLQFAAVPAAGEPAVCCRDVEAYYLERTAAWQDHAFWTDTDDPFSVGAGMVRRLLGPRPRLGVELAAWPLSAARHERLSATLAGATLEDASDLVRSLRLVKSPREIAYMRLAGRCAEAGMAAAPGRRCREPASGRSRPWCATP